MVLFEYNLTVSNSASADDDESVVLTDTLPAGIVFDGAGSDPRCKEVATGLVRCVLGDLAGGDSTTVRLSVFPENAGVFINTAYVAGDEIDSNLANNFDSTNA